MNIRLLGFITIVLCSFKLFSQNTIPANQSIIYRDGFGSDRKVVKLDPISRRPIGSVPFDRTFIIRLYFDQHPDTGNADTLVNSFFLLTDEKHQNKTQKLAFYLISKVAKNPNGKNPGDYDATDSYLKVFPNAIDVVVPALPPNQHFTLVYTTNVNDPELVQYIKVFKYFYDEHIKEGVANEDTYRAAQGGDPQISPGKQLLDYYNQHSEVKTIFDKYGGTVENAIAELKVYMLNNKTYQHGKIFPIIFQKIVVAAHGDTSITYRQTRRFR